MEQYRIKQSITLRSLINPFHLQFQKEISAYSLGLHVTSRHMFLKYKIKYMHCTAVFCYTMCFLQLFKSSFQRNVNFAWVTTLNCKIELKIEFLYNFIQRLALFGIFILLDTCADYLSIFLDNLSVRRRFWMIGMIQDFIGWTLWCFSCFGDTKRAMLLYEHRH